MVLCGELDLGMPYMLGGLSVGQNVYIFWIINYTMEISGGYLPSHSIGD